MEVVLPCDPLSCAFLTHIPSIPCSDPLSCVALLPLSFVSLILLCLFPVLHLHTSEFSPDHHKMVSVYSELGVGQAHGLGHVGQRTLIMNEILNESRLRCCPSQLRAHLSILPLLLYVFENPTHCLKGTEFSVHN